MNLVRLSKMTKYFEIHMNTGCDESFVTTLFSISILSVVTKLSSHPVTVQNCEVCELQSPSLRFYTIIFTPSRKSAVSVISNSS